MSKDRLIFTVKEARTYIVEPPEEAKTEQDYLPPDKVAGSPSKPKTENQKPKTGD